MLKVIINHESVNEGFNIGYFLEAVGMVRTENCFWTAIYQGKNPDDKYVYAIVNVCDNDHRPTSPTEWQSKILDFMGLDLIDAPTSKELKERYAVAIVSENVILHIHKDGLSKAFDLWHKVKKHIPDAKLAVISSKSKKYEASDKVTLYTVDYNGIGFNTVGRRFFTTIEDAKEFSEKPLRDKPIKRTYTYANAKKIIEEQDQLDDWAQRGYYLPDYE